MTAAPAYKKGLLSERVVVATIAAVLVALWIVGQANALTVIIVGGVATALLIRLEIKRRMEMMALRRSEVRKRQTQQLGIRSVRAQALNGLPSPVLMIDQDHKIIFANTEAFDLLGVDIVGEDAFLFLRQPELVRVINKALENSSSTDQEQAVRYTTAKDRNFDVSVVAIPSEGDSEEDHALVFFYEVTSLLRTERMRVDFVANASHELKTPLASLMGSIETLQGPARDDPDGQTRFLTIMQKETERMARLVDDLLSLSRIELARHQTPDSPIDLQMTVFNVISSLNTIADKRGIRFNVAIPKGLPEVKADEDQITQVLINLLFNASKYADKDTTVHVTAQKNPNGTSITLAVRDEGPGIAAEHLARLTERFYRVDTARSRQMGGTGLGLAIVKHILLRHDSQLDIKSAVGVGSTFSFHLKIAEPDTSNAGPDDPEALLLASSGTRH